MEMYFGNRGIESFLVVKPDKGNETTAMQNHFKSRMLEENNICGLLIPTASELDGQLCLRYDISGNYVLSRHVIKQRPNAVMFKKVIQEILDCMETLEEFFLNADDLVINQDYMFLEKTESRLKMVYAPGYNKNIKSQLKGFVEYVMMIFDTGDREGVQLVYRVYELLTADECCIDEIRNVLDFERSVKPEYQEHTDDNRVIWKDEGVVVDDTTNKVKISLWKLLILAALMLGTVVMLVRYFCFGRVRLDIYVSIVFALMTGFYGISAFFGENENPDEAMKEYLPQSQPIQYTQEYSQEYDQIQQSEGEIYDIRPVKMVPLTNGVLKEICFSDYKDGLTLGRGKKECDYRLQTTQISRIHSSIYIKAEGIYLEDRGSTNGTFINGERLLEHEQRKLHRGDIISFADEEFFVS